MGIVNKLRAGHPRSQGHRRRGKQQDFTSIQGDAREEPIQPLSSLLRTSTLEQIVGPKHDDQQIRVCREGGGSSGDLPAVLPQVADSPAGFHSQDVNPSAVSVISPTQIRTRVVAVGVGVAEADNIHPVHTFHRYCSTNAHGSIAQTFFKRSTVYTHF